ncbi:MAG: hypothetical protein DHS20C16_34510 [Phycisphaerae bacterium]|nr:MAG: hypothetical protein DHS20C16_34510 [Phycisphaerae bacterium]
MDLLDRLLQHDAWTTQVLLQLAQDLSDEQLDREFDLGHRTLRATFHHLIYNMEAWSALMDGRDVVRSENRTVAGMLKRLEAAAAVLADVARRVADRRGWDETWTDHLDDPPSVRTFGGSIAHVMTHSMHHRAQILYMLRMLGIGDLPEGDVLSWEDQCAPPNLNQ